MLEEDLLEGTKDDELERELLDGTRDDELERELLDGTKDDELERLLELNTLDELPQAAVTPKGEGWLVQVALDIQLLLFS